MQDKNITKINPPIQPYVHDTWPIYWLYMDTNYYKNKPLRVEVAVYSIHIDVGPGTSICEVDVIHKVAVKRTNKLPGSLTRSLDDKNLYVADANFVFHEREPCYSNHNMSCNYQVEAIIKDVWGETRFIIKSQFSIIYPTHSVEEYEPEKEAKLFLKQLYERLYMDVVAYRASISSPVINY